MFWILQNKINVQDRVERRRNVRSDFVIVQLSNFKLRQVFFKVLYWSYFITYPNLSTVKFQTLSTTTSKQLIYNFPIITIIILPTTSLLRSARPTPWSPPTRCRRSASPSTRSPPCCPSPTSSPVSSYPSSSTSSTTSTTSPTSSRTWRQPYCPTLAVLYHFSTPLWLT